MSPCWWRAGHPGRSMAHPHAGLSSRTSLPLLFPVIAPPANPCEDGSHTCAPVGQARCIHHGGSTFSCICLPGYAGNGHHCTGESASVARKVALRVHGHVHSRVLSQKELLPSLVHAALGLPQEREKRCLLSQEGGLPLGHIVEQMWLHWVEPLLELGQPPRTFCSWSWWRLEGLREGLLSCEDVSTSLSRLNSALPVEPV